MKMLRITKGVTSVFHSLPYTDLIGFFHKLQCALKYETPIFQEFIICLFDNLFPIWVYINALFLRLTFFFCLF